MAWQVEGRYFENCSCDFPCPCTVSFDAGATHDRCNAILIFHVDSGEVDGVDVAGRTVVAVADTPKVMTDGNWKLGVIVDDGASDEQVEKLGAVFGGQAGGPMEALSPLVGEVLGIERQPIDFSSEGGTHRVKIGEATEVEVADVVPFGAENGEPARLEGILHPAGSSLTIARAQASEIDAFGIRFSNPGGSGFSNRFAWSA